ncbi:hypothetical protein CGZ75_07255 [Paenibacillus herberti]|uniref:Uncharacterized protein n=1 Tax=Paenibacillus herberti TaxID=1619309 RepID=A0A229P2K1_9BACL|nr:hypothetical protein CGZ75_07255 [Paenibacillus herberti]
MNIGMILVLFILIVVVAQTFCKESNRTFPIQPDNGFPSIAASLRFEIRNDSSYRLSTISLSGDFEPPLPAQHTIPPGGFYRYEVLVIPRRATVARVTYAVVGNDGASVGSLSTAMYRTIYFGAGFESTIIQGPIFEQTEGRIMRVYDRL